MNVMLDTHTFLFSVFRDLSGQETYTEGHCWSMSRWEKGLSRTASVGPNCTENCGIPRFPDIPFLGGTHPSHGPPPHHLFALSYLKKPTGPLPIGHRRARNRG